MADQRKEKDMPKIKEAPRPRTKKVRFAVRLPQADEVVLTGDFIRWNPDGIQLHHNGADEWYVHLDLAPGDYQYRLRADGQWVDDPEATRRVDNPFGTQNCVLTVA
jgi:1,4-alpha-glucan branching enzyme